MNIEHIIKRSESKRGYEYPDIFKDDCGLDIKIPEKKIHAVKSWGYRKGNPKRRATLEISTFVGISFNAIHYYGKIVIQGVEMEYDDKSHCFTSVFDKNIPLAHSEYELELTRPISKEEIAEDPDRWGNYYKEGDLTNCFESIEDIIDFSKDVFKARFDGDWEFVVEAPYKTYSGIINI